jgi:hypothetical protein
METENRNNNYAEYLENFNHWLDSINDDFLNNYDNK